MSSSHLYLRDNPAFEDDTGKKPRDVGPRHNDVRWLGQDTAGGAFTGVAPYDVRWLENDVNRGHDFVSRNRPLSRQYQHPPLTLQLHKIHPHELDSPDDEDPPPDEDDESLLGLLKKSIRSKMSASQIAWTKVVLRVLVLVTLVFAYLAYFIAVLVVPTEAEEGDYWCHGDGFLILITSFAVGGIIYFQILKPSSAAQFFSKSCSPLLEVLTKPWDYWYVQLATYLILIGVFVAFLAVDTHGERERLISAGGIAVLVLFGFVFSKAPRKVRWRHVAWGLSLQFLLGFTILRWEVGRNAFDCLGNKIQRFLSMADAGSSFVFGSLVTDLGIFGFKVLPVILFFSFCIQILYYFGIMQWVVMKLGWILQVTIGTTACESVNAAANIFLGQSEAPLLIKPFMEQMTRSELHAVMTGGFATIAGSVMAAFIGFGVNPAHLLSASVMSAPAALCFSKLFYPETSVSKTSADNIHIDKGDEVNALHAAMNGVTTAISLVANIAANLVAFIAFVAFVDLILTWCCSLVGAEGDTCKLESIFGYVFMPLAWMMGVPWDDCYYVGQLIGTKTIINEFVAYLNLVDLKKKGKLSERAEVIATYALCGFSNISGIGIHLGALGAMAPKRRADLATVAFRAFIAGSVACFLTASVAGTLIGASYEAPMTENGTVT